ncbi:hypothetical protein ACFQGW_05745 [Xanthomonas theicola]|uniref:hypothetical protein n=1 Tax=Xanthomonas theicola TaxID=56464 RepID=UPI00360FDB2D
MDDRREQFADPGLGQSSGQERRLDRIARLPVRAAVLGNQRSAKQFGRDLFDQRRGHVLVPEQRERIRIDAGHHVSGRTEIEPKVAAKRPFRSLQQARQVAHDGRKMPDHGESAAHDRNVVSRPLPTIQRVERHVHQQRGAAGGSTALARLLQPSA